MCRCQHNPGHKVEQCPHGWARLRSFCWRHCCGLFAVWGLCHLHAPIKPAVDCQITEAACDACMRVCGPYPEVRHLQQGLQAHCSCAAQVCALVNSIPYAQCSRQCCPQPTAFMHLYMRATTLLSMRMSAPEVPHDAGPQPGFCTVFWALHTLERNITERMKNAMPNNPGSQYTGMLT